MKIKRIVAIVTAATMVLGCGLTAMASGSGSTTARGTSSGHVNRTYVSVTLPLSGTSTFNYIIDPERIIQETVETTDGFTAGGEVVSPLNEGIYFVTSSSATGNLYAPKSNELTAYNNSSKAIDLTVTVSSTYSANAIQFADSITNRYTGGGSDTMDTTPLLYMGLGSKITTTTGGEIEDLEAVAKDGNVNKVSQTFTLDGNPANFKIKSKAGAYVYEPLDVAPDASSWSKVDFWLQGECSYSDISNITTAAPDMSVTWSWVENGVTPAVASYVSTNTVSQSSNAVTLSAPSGVTLSGVTLTLGGNDYPLNNTQYTLSGTTLTIGSVTDAWAGGTIKLTFSDGHEDVLTCE